MAERKKKDPTQTTVFEKEPEVIKEEIKTEVIKEEVKPPFPERAQSLEESRRGDTRQPEKVKVKREPNPNNILVKAKLLKEENEKLKLEISKKSEPIPIPEVKPPFPERAQSLEESRRGDTRQQIVDAPKRVAFNTLDNARQKQILKLLGRF